jgi:outer membrane immunogenic protein
VTNEPLNDTAFRFSPYAGWNLQVAPRLVVGVEGDWGFANKATTLSGVIYPNQFSGIAADSFSVKTTWDASVRGRIGFLATPSVLAYATGGGAWLHVESTSTCNSASPSCSIVGAAPAVITDSKTKTGWTVGGGLEAVLWSNWIARAEYRYADFGTITNTDVRTTAAGPRVITYDLTVKTHTALFGLAYKFDWSSPVAAKY